MSTPTATPRTDELAKREFVPDGVWIRHARQLETELAALTIERDQLRAEVERLKRDYEYAHKCLHEVRERCESWKQRAERAEAELAKYLSACPVSPTEEERKRCQQWWAISGRSP